MTSDVYVARVRALVERQEWNRALAFAERHGPRFEERLSLEQAGILNSLLHLAAQAHRAAARSGPVLPVGSPRTLLPS